MRFRSNHVGPAATRDDGPWMGETDAAHAGLASVEAAGMTAGDQFFFIIPSSFFMPSFDIVSFFMPSSLDM